MKNSNCGMFKIIANLEYGLNVQSFGISVGGDYILTNKPHGLDLYACIIGCK